MEMLIIFIVAIVASLFFGLINKNKEKSFYKDESNKENDRYIAKNTDTTRGKSKRFLKIKLSDDFFLSEQEKQGLKGEKEVAFYLDRIASHFGGYVFDSFIFKDEDDYSSEIDHILITQGGVFIIETKAQKGIITGNVENELWYSTNEYGDINTFRNPIHQNDGHIRHLRKMLKKNAPYMFSIIIFPFANIGSVSYPQIHHLEDAMKYIVEETEKGKYTKDFVEKMKAQFTYIKEVYGISKEEHLENIKAHHQSNQS